MKVGAGTSRRPLHHLDLRDSFDAIEIRVSELFGDDDEDEA